MHTPEFKRHFIEYVHPVTLLVLRRVCKPWQRVAESYIKELMEHGVLVLHQGKDTSVEVAMSTAWKGMMKLVTQMSFLQNVTQIGVHACYFAVNLVVVDIPEGVERIGGGAFGGCISLTTASFPSTLKSIGDWAFNECSSLDNVDLLCTNLQEIGEGAFALCYELKSMTIPDSFQTLGLYVVHKCSELVPSNIDVSDADNDTTSEVVECLRARMNLYLTLNPNNLNPQLFVVETEDKIADAEKENAEEGFGKEKQLSELRAAMELLKLQLASTTTNSNI